MRVFPRDGSLSLLFACVLSLCLTMTFGCAAKNETAPTEYQNIANEGASLNSSSDGYSNDYADDYADDFTEAFDDEFEDYSYDESARIADPLEGWNRMWFGFNDFFLVNIAKPVYDGYDYITPDEVQKGANNFFHNLLFPVRFINALLQGEPLMAGVEFSRFVVNSTLGFGGLMDVTKHKKPVVEPDIDGFGQTLGRWGVGEGCYIVWPFVGPSSVRDSAGWVGDYFLDPTWIFLSTKESIALSAYENLNSLGAAIDAYETFKASSIEPYIAVRNAYLQMRRESLKRKNP